MWNGEWLAEPSAIRKAFHDHFSNFFRDHHSKLISLGSFSLPKLQEKGRISLTLPISLAEIECALHSLADDKAPSPDRMNIKSIKILWPYIGKKVVSFIENFCLSLKIPTGANSSFIALIPKVATPALVKDYRPISLINSSI